MMVPISLGLSKHLKLVWTKIFSFGPPMGYALPASIEAIAKDKKNICIDGDGSLQINIQELHTRKIITQKFLY